MGSVVITITLPAVAMVKSMTQQQEVLTHIERHFFLPKS